jgi:uncharacterized protein YbjT (DUF2867 family)
MARILITGATGFIGRHLVQVLSAAGHDIVRATRLTRHTAPGEDRLRFIDADFTRDHSPGDWLPRLAGIDVVINTVGILRQDAHRSFEAIHVKAPCALFEACARSKVKLIIQFSALGADERAQSQYHRSKREADDFLARSSIPHVIVQPSLVYGTGGTSAKLFTRLASAPVIPLPGDGDQRVQPIHIDDITSAVRNLIDNGGFRNQRVPLVGPTPLTLREFLARLRQALGLGKPRFLRVPLVLVRAFAELGALTPASLLDDETLAMLLRGNTADPGLTRRLLGHSPRPVTEFIGAGERDTAITTAKLQWLLPVLRVSIALVWIVSGIVSLGIYPVEESYALLARAGIGGWLAPVFLYGAAVMDLVFGIAILVLPHRRLLWLAQIVVIVVYTVIITFKLPEFWLHPYGPVVKNLPLLAAIWLLYELEQR